MVQGERRSAAGDAEVWLVDPRRGGDQAGPSAGPADAGLLTPDERARAARFRHADDRRSYATAHAALRLLLAARLGGAPAAVPLDRAPCPLCGGPHGRVVVAGGAVEVSLSRTRGLVAVALSRSVVGVDLESDARPVDPDDLAIALHPAERHVTDRAGMLRLWVRKEAYLKGRGTGLGVDPASVDLTGDPPGWRVHDVDAGPGWHAAVAVRPDEPAGGSRVTVRRVGLGDLLAGGQGVRMAAS